MKAVLEFDLSDPSDRTSHYEVIHAHGCFSVLRDLDDDLRNYLKHTNDSEDLVTAVTGIREKLTQLCEENGVDIWRD